MRGVTLVVPTFNEESFIEPCLRSAIEDPDVQILVVDGRSTDGTREVVHSLTPEFPGLRLLDNPKRTAAAAMNLGIAHASGEIVVRLDAHARYPAGYVRRLVSALREHGADVAGGVWIPQPRRKTLFGRAIAASLANRWVMGNSGFRVGGGEVREVDTVPFGCWETESIRRAGGFNEALDRSQDYDLSQRLRRAGAKIILLPDLHIEYRARSGVWENVRYTFWNGYWVGYPLVAHDVRFAPRHLVAAIACATGLVTLLACLSLGSVLPLLIGLPYVTLLALSGIAALRHGLAVAAWQPVITVATHTLYGLGTWYGLARGIARRPR